MDGVQDSTSSEEDIEEMNDVQDDDTSPEEGTLVGDEGVLAPSLLSTERLPIATGPVASALQDDASQSTSQRGDSPDNTTTPSPAERENGDNFPPPNHSLASGIPATSNLRRIEVHLQGPPNPDDYERVVLSPAVEHMVAEIDADEAYLVESDDGDLGQVGAPSFLLFNPAHLPVPSSLFTPKPHDPLCLPRFLGDG